MKKLKVKNLILIGCILMTGFLVWFAFNNQLSARPIAQAILKGLAFSLRQTIENLAVKDPSFRALYDFDYRDIAYFAIIDKNGTFKFHRNPELIGDRVEDRRYINALSTTEPIENKVLLGTGEVVYEVHFPMQIKEEKFILRLALHTWQANQIINRAKAGATILLSVTAGAWILGFLLIRMLKREALLKEQMMKQAQLAKLGELGALLAHEVRTPLAGIKGYSQLLTEKIVDERLSRFANLITQEVIRLEGLVNDLLDYARNDNPGDGNTYINKDIIISVWDMISEGEKFDKIKLSVSIDKEVWVKCRKERFWQLLMNLFSNARYAIQSEGVVQVMVREQRDTATIIIQDSGPGFTEEAIQKAFEPFFTTGPRGSGLGLAICRKIVEGCGGKISALNSKEGGAIIKITLPVVKIKREKE